MSDKDPPETAIALQYERGQVGAPRIAASGQGWLAARILELAHRHNIPVREDAELAQMLSAFEPGDEIPVEAFAAVATILARIYQANSRIAAGDTP